MALLRCFYAEFRTQWVVNVRCIVGLVPLLPRSNPCRGDDTADLVADPLPKGSPDSRLPTSWLDREYH